MYFVLCCNMCYEELLLAINKIYMYVKYFIKNKIGETNKGTNMNRNRGESDGRMLEGNNK